MSTMDLHSRRGHPPLTTSNNWRSFFKHSPLLSPSPSPSTGLSPAASPAASSSHLPTLSLPLSQKPQKPRSKSVRLPTKNPTPPAIIVPQSPPPQQPKLLSPLSPKAMGQSAIRVLRRVASAPNTKNLAKRKSAVYLQPAASQDPSGQDTVPPLPTSPSFASNIQSTSLDTLSSGSSGDRNIPRYRNRPNTSTGLASPPSTPSAQHPSFRRTYSSNSIKVSAVRFFPSLSTTLSRVFSNMHSSVPGGGRPEQFSEDKNSRTG
jgi:protein-serine/threonine kinase